MCVGEGDAVGERVGEIGEAGPLHAHSCPSHTFSFICLLHARITLFPHSTAESSSLFPTMTSYSDDDDLLEDSDSLPPIWGPPTCFCEARHTEAIRAIADQEQAWRMKERVSNGLT